MGFEARSLLASSTAPFSSKKFKKRSRGFGLFDLTCLSGLFGLSVCGLGARVDEIGLFGVVSCVIKTASSSTG